MERLDGAGRLVRSGSGCLETVGIAVFAILLGAFAMSTWMRHGGDEERIAGVTDRVDPDAPPAVRTRIRIEVRNGSGEPGAAQSMTRYLRDRGFDVVDFGNAESFDHERTAILAHGGGPSAAREVGLVLPGVPIRPAGDPSPYIDITVVVGPDIDQILLEAGSTDDESSREWWNKFTGWLDRLPWP